MVSIALLLKDASDILNEIKLREEDAERNRRKEFLAARRIQSCFRGWLVRKHYWQLREAASSIQKLWRGYVGRKTYISLLKNHIEKLSRQHFNIMATKIQKRWRGHFVRTRVFDYYLFRSWIQDILEKNDKMVQQMMVFREQSEASMMDKMEAEAKEWVMFILFKLHHQLRTYSRPGIFSLQNSTELSELEQQLKTLRFADHMKAVRSRRLATRRRQGGCLTHWWRSEDCHHPRTPPRDIIHSPPEKPLHEAPMRFPGVRHDDRGIYLEPGPYQPRHPYHTRDLDTSRIVGEAHFVSRVRPAGNFDQLAGCRYE